MVKDGAQSKKKPNKNSDFDASGDIYKKAVSFEEKEATQRSAEKDAGLYLQTCSDIRQLLADIYKEKCEEKENKSLIMLKRKEACLKIVLLKKLNRLEKVRMSMAREQLNQEKQKLDSINLQFQNLLYELAHLCSEFEKCRQYKSKDEDIQLISTEEFLKVAPEEVVGKFTEVQTADNNLRHELHLAMLEHELQQRIKLSKLCDTLDNEKRLLGKDIVNRKEKLDALGPTLSNIIEATKPLQELLGLPLEKTRNEHKMASLLPDELYLLYYNGEGYKVIDSRIAIEIVGDQEEAQQFNASRLNIVEDSDADSLEEPEPMEGKKRRHRKASLIDKMEEKKRKILEPHPLSIEITMDVPNGGPQLKIKFLYRVQLKIITVTSNVEIPSKITGNCAKEVLSGEGILNEIFDGDTGKESPNSKNQYQLDKVNLGTFESLIQKIGFAYGWAHKLCGLEFMKKPGCKLTNKVSPSYVESVLRSLRSRLDARYALAEQLQQLEQNFIPMIPSEVEHPKTATSVLTKFAPMSFARFCTETPNSVKLVEEEMASANDLFYSATVIRHKSILSASIVIKNTYPIRAPLFLLTVKSNGDHSATNSDDIRDMERALNLGWQTDEKSAGWLLAVQLRYLCSFFDVYLESVESSSITASGATPTQSTVFFRSVCARNRRRPFKYRKVGNGVFTQY
ncbi:PREDICTED: THO complex subunit 5 homolog [Nicrophorus vespilloides]|uniref:THO complex subunit 5 homolog n=1 Tax=Nicrophorus vespilloides TaxID=110193 RepID=A0ABM1M8M7_NICVS|nr:PREDICTED: THO complex subunit 5 homolog [Nicrophorus vespilloides]